MKIRTRSHPRRPAAYRSHNQLPVLTRHAWERRWERNISQRTCDLISHHGAWKRAWDGRWRQQIERTILLQLKREGVAPRVLEEAVGVYLILSPCKRFVVTVAHDQDRARISQYEALSALLLDSSSAAGRRSV